MFELGKARRLRLRAVMVAGAVLALLAIGGGAVLVNAGGSSSTIYACVSSKTGAITIVDATVTCAKNQYAISWQSGTSSPPPAPTIITRYTAEQGPQAIDNSQFYTIASTQITVPDGTTLTASASGTLQTTSAGAADCEIQVTGSANLPYTSVTQSGSAAANAPGNISLVVATPVTSDTLTVSLMCTMENLGGTTSGQLSNAQLLVQAVPTN